MARTVLPPSVLTGNGAIVNMTNAGANMTAADNVNGMSVSVPTNTIPAGPDIDHLVLLVLNTNAVGQTVTIRAATPDGGNAKVGAGTPKPAFTYPAFEAGKGDLVTAAMVATTGIGIIGPFEVARFLQPDNTISIDFSGATGFVAALLVPRSF